MSFKTRHYTSGQQGQDKIGAKVNFVISALPPRPTGVSCQTFGWQQAALSVLPGRVLPQPLRLVSLQLQICLPCTYVPLGSALRASDVTKQPASEWKWHYILESSTHASCVILMIPVLRIHDIRHKGGRDNACFWSLMWFWSQSSITFTYTKSIGETVTSSLDQKKEKRSRQVNIKNFQKTKTNYSKTRKHLVNKLTFGKFPSA